jgi:hypothetical protein
MAWTDENVESFYVTLGVIFNQPKDGPCENGKKTLLIGYYINIGLNARNRNEALKILESVIKDGKIDWADSIWTEMSDIDPKLALNSVGVAAGEIWHKSGRALFPDSDIE